MNRLLVGIIAASTWAHSAKFAPNATVPSSAQSQQLATIAGRITDVKTGTPLRFANIIVEGTSNGSVSDADGRYRITRIIPGQVTLRITRIGYAPMTRAGVVVTAKGPNTVDVSLTVQALMLTGVVSTGLVDPASGTRLPFTVATAAARDAAAKAAMRRPADVVIQIRNPNSIAFVTPSQERQVACARRPCVHNTESYAGIVDNPFLGAAVNPLSTFSVDVDRASYSNVRRYIKDGETPPKDAVRIEEFINYFPYDYPPVAMNNLHPFQVTTELTAAPWKREHRLVRIALQAPRLETATLPPSNLVFLIDVSGSMQADNKLPLVKESLRMLVEQLRAQDRVAIAVYAGTAGLVLEPTSGADKRTILNAIDRLQAGGSTAGGEGIKLAYSIARQHRFPGGNNRVILATDGDFNVGVSSDAEMGRLIEAERQHGIYLTVLGYGMGNYKDSKLETIADKGNGNYAYIDDIVEARKVLVNEMGGTLYTVAKDVKLQVEFNPDRVRAYRLIGYENRALRSEDFADDKKDAGEIGAGHSVTALYEVILTGSATDVIVRTTDSLRYQRPAGVVATTFANEIMLVKVRYKKPDADSSIFFSQSVTDRATPPSRDFTFTAAVAALGMIMRNSEHKGSATIADVLEMAQRSLGPDVDGYRAEFLNLVRAYEKTVSAAAAGRIER